jgi:phosphodiesterase/alkaline phosphatase D-like protein
MDTRTIVLLASLCCAGVAYSETTPCALLSRDQVSAAVGAGVGAGSPIAQTGCTWTTTAPPNVIVTVSMQSEKMFAAVKASNPPKTTKTSVSGVGDEAIFTGVQGFSSLWVRKGTKFLLVRIYGVSVPEAQTKLKTLAANAVSKL